MSLNTQMSMNKLDMNEYTLYLTTILQERQILRVFLCLVIQQFLFVDGVCPIRDNLLSSDRIANRTFINNRGKTFTVEFPSFQVRPYLLRR